MSEEQTQTFEQVVDAFYPEESAEPLEAPTEDSSEENTPDESEDVEEESEEAESTEEAEDESEDAEAIEIDGEQHNLSDVQEWKQAHDNVKLMQADCTKKWQEAADLKKDAEAQLLKGTELVIELEALIATEDIEQYKDINSDNYDPDKYIELEALHTKRKEKLAELKANQPKQGVTLSKDELAAEANDFYAYDAEWKDGDKLTAKFNEDMKLAGEYLQERGYTQEEINNVSMSHHWKTIIDASRYNKEKTKTTAIKKKVLKTPKSSKVKAKAETARTPEEIFYGANK